MSEAASIVVLGAGPAGAAVALGLAALGFDVTVVAGRAPRTRGQRESFSVRVVAALRALGVEAALDAMETSGLRQVRWAGDARELPGEAQVERAAFDAGLLADLTRRGVRVIRDEAIDVSSRDAVTRIALAIGPALEARFVVEARGRAAPSGGARERGPELLCIVQRWRRAVSAARALPAAGVPRIAIVSLAEGWAWLADDGRGALTTQLAWDANAAPARAELAADCERALRDDASCRELLGGMAPDGEAFARAATPVLDGALVTERGLRVGDAALAVDPLSGNGVFQALSTALVAPAVIRTWLQRPERAELARSFYIERARELFLRFARVSRDFYALGAVHHGGAFWEARAAWPDTAPAHAGDRGATLALAMRPVVCDGWIEEREVVLTPERPLGTWQVAGIELAPLVRACAAEPGASRAVEEARSAREMRALAALPDAAREPVRAWLRAHSAGMRALPL